jgi:hypothetical protein
MATSSSTDFTLNRDAIITAALRKLRVVDPNNTANANDITTGAQALNLMIKAWQMDGVSMWLNQEAVLHLALESQTYALGATGDHFCALSDAGKTQLSATSAAGDTTLEVDSDGESMWGDIIGIELDDGSLDWDIIASTPASNVITITTGLTSAASIDNYVFWYTAKLARPVEILEARLRDVADNDAPINITTSSEEFMRITDKTSLGDASTLHLIPTITNSKLYVWPVCDDVTKRIVMTIRRVIEDFDAAANEADIPVECLEAVIFNLAKRLMMEYGIGSRSEIGADILFNAGESFKIMKNFYRNREPVQFTP